MTNTLSLIEITLPLSFLDSEDVETLCLYPNDVDCLRLLMKIIIVNKILVDDLMDFFFFGKKKIIQVHHLIASRKN